MNKDALIALRYPVCLIAFAVIPAQAANWTTSAGVAPAVTYTDNVCLDPDNEQGEWIALVTPDVGIRANGNRANLNLAAAVEFNSLTDSRLENLGCRQGFGNRDQFSPRISGSADAIIVENWLFIDASVNSYQNEVTPFASGGGDSLNRTGNTNTTYQYTVNPYIARRFKETAELFLGYTYDDQYNTEDVVGDSSEQRVAFNLGSVPGLSSFIWGIQGNYSEVTYSDERELEVNNDSQLKSAQLNLGYQLNRTWQVNGFYGQEWNDFVSSNDDIDGDFWDVGFRWTPNARTTVDAGTGDRFFGNSPRFSASYRHKRSMFRASYRKTLTYDRDIRELNETSAPDPDFNPPSDLNPGQSTLTNSPILDERFTLGYTYEGRRSGFGLSAYQSEQKRTDNNTDTSYSGVQASVDRSLSSEFTVSGGLSWNEQEPTSDRDTFVENSEVWSATLGARHQLGENTTLAFSYRYTDRQSNNAFDEYTENRFTLTLRVGL